MRPLGELRQRATALRVWALAGIALLLAHDAIHLVQVGPGEPLVEALRRGTHAWWGAGSLVLVVAAVLAGAVTLQTLRRLRRRARTLAPASELSAPRRRGRSYVRRVVLSWIRLFVVVAVGFAVQENVEHFLGHGHFIGFGALGGPEYPLAIPVIAALSAVGALVAALVHDVEAELRELIARALVFARGRAPRRLARPPLAPDLSPRREMADSGATRAPPRSALVPVS